MLEEIIQQITKCYDTIKKYVLLVRVKRGILMRSLL